jgi:adenylate kinase
LSIPKVSTGDIFRANVSGGTELGKQAKAYMDRGDLVPDEVTNAMVRDRLAQEDAQGGFLLDGFPRNVAQAETLNKILGDLDERLDAVLELRVDEEEVVKRLSGRRSCRNCGHVQHVDFDPPATAGVCDACGGELFQREDDKEETIRHRLEVYREQTAPLVQFYENEGILLTIEAVGSVADVTARAKAALGNRS